MLIKLLLQKGYSVNTTARDPGDEEKIWHLLKLQDLGDLKIFKANLTDEKSFDVVVKGCDVVFLVATPVNFSSQNPETDMIKSAMQGVTNVLTNCTKAKFVKRVVMMNEEDWTDVNYLYSKKPPLWGYPVSKTLAEIEAWKFAKVNNLDLITMVPSLIAGASLTPDVPSSIGLATCLLTGNEFLINGLKGMQSVSGSISITHVEDVCRAHIKKLASGRYICCAVNTSFIDLVKFLSNRYPQYNVPADFGDFTSKAKLILSSEKLINEGFEFKYGIKEIYDSAVNYLKSKDLLND